VSPESTFSGNSSEASGNLIVPKNRAISGGLQERRFKRWFSPETLQKKAEERAKNSLNAEGETSVDTSEISCTTALRTEQPPVPDLGSRLGYDMENTLLVDRHNSPDHGPALSDEKENDDDDHGRARERLAASAKAILVEAEASADGTPGCVYVSASPFASEDVQNVYRRWADTMTGDTESVLGKDFLRRRHSYEVLMTRVDRPLERLELFH